MPPYQENQQLSEAIKTMSFVEPVPYKRRRFDNSLSKNYFEKIQNYNCSC